MPLYDELSEPMQAAVRARWASRVAATLDRLDFTDALRDAGEPWAEADEQGNLVMQNTVVDASHGPSATSSR